MAKEGDAYSLLHFRKILQELSSQNLKLFVIYDNPFVKINMFSVKKGADYVFKEVATKMKELCNPQKQLLFGTHLIFAIAFLHLSENYENFETVDQWL